MNFSNHPRYKQIQRIKNIFTFSKKIINLKSKCLSDVALFSNSHQLLTLQEWLKNLYIIKVFFRIRGLPIAEQMAQTMAKVGPSLLMTSVSEIFCFAIGKRLEDIINIQPMSNTIRVQDLNCAPFGLGGFDGSLIHVNRRLRGVSEHVALHYTTTCLYCLKLLSKA